MRAASSFGAGLAGPARTTAASAAVRRAGARIACRTSGALLLGAIASVHPAASATLTVNDSGDAGPGDCTSVCTLRDAIASAAAGGDIDFAPGLAPATIMLSQGQLTIDKSLSIRGPGAEQLAISANLASRVLALSSMSPITVSISGMTLRDGKTGASQGGGCVYTAGTIWLSLEQVAVRDCVAQGGNGGRGGSGIPNPNIGGAGGPGGGAYGGAIYYFSGSPTFKLVLRDSSVSAAVSSGQCCQGPPALRTGVPVRDHRGDADLRRSRRRRHSRPVRHGASAGRRMRHRRDRGRLRVLRRVRLSAAGREHGRAPTTAVARCG